MSEVCVIGAGHVGLVTTACLAKLGHQVIAVDKDAERIERLSQGQSPFYEPGLDELLQQGLERQRLAFSTQIADGVQSSEIIFICVGTPPMADGRADLAQVEEVARTVAQHMESYKLIVEKSTVPVKTSQWIKRTIGLFNRTGIEFDVASNPEFLREGSAIKDFMQPDRIVIGVESERAKALMLKLYEGFDCPILVTDINTAEIIKHASNSFLAMKISFINMVADLCERAGADVQMVAEGMGYDARIGRAFLNAGVGYGGSCLLPDEVAFISDRQGVEVVEMHECFDRFDPQEPMSVLSFDAAAGQILPVRVKAVMRRAYQGEVIHLRARMGRRISVTADHPVIIYSDGLQVKLANEVVVGDRLVLPTGPIEGATASMEINLLNELERRPLPASVIIRSNGQFASTFDAYSRFVTPDLLKDRCEIKQSDMMSSRVYQALKIGGHLEVSEPELQLYTARGAATFFPTVVRLDGNFCRLLGHYLAEGWITCDVGRKGAVRERVGFCFGEHEREYVEDLHAILTRLGVKFSVKRDAKSHTLTTIVSSKVFATLLRDVLRLGANSYDKQLPAFIFVADEAQRRELLRGLWSGDGSVSRPNQGRHICYEFATVSKRLGEGLLLLLASVGIVASLKRRWANKSTQETYFISINGFDQVARLRAIFGSEKAVVVDRALDGYQRHIAPTGQCKLDGMALVPVTRVEREAYSGDVYSLETTNGQLLTSGGLLMHNCFPKDVKAFAKIAEDLGLELDLLREVDRINESRADRLMEKVKEALWVCQNKTIGILGLAFKPDTDDIREAVSLKMVERLVEQGARLRLYDAKAAENMKAVFPPQDGKIEYVASPCEAAREAEALLILTEWEEFKELDLPQIKRLMRTPIIVDGRNIFDPDRVREVGFEYYCMGRRSIRNHF
ncbi:MAG: nucleotide sugar dehydrogenase [Acidobacteria bacterium]|nr:nucleotide sugar dehydrogenase [Acidobacteriota bacterium]